MISFIKLVSPHYLVLTSRISTCASTNLLYSVIATITLSSLSLTAMETHNPTR